MWNWIQKFPTEIEVRPDSHLSHNALQPCASSGEWRILLLLRNQWTHDNATWLMEIENTQADLRCLWGSNWTAENRSDTSVSSSSKHLAITASLTCEWSTNNGSMPAMFPKDNRHHWVLLYFLQHPHPLHWDLPGGFCTLCFWRWVILLCCLRSIFQQPCFGRTALSAWICRWWTCGKFQLN